MCLVLLSCFVLVIQSFSDETGLTPRSDCSSTGQTCTLSANLVQSDSRVSQRIVSEEASPDIQGWVDAHETVGLASTPQSSVAKSDAESEFANPPATSSGELHQIGAQSTLVAEHASNDAPLVSPSEQRGRISEDVHIKAHMESPAASFASLLTSINENSGEARLEENVEDASAKGTVGFSKTVLAWLQLVSRGGIVGVQRLPSPGAHIVPIVLPMLLIIVLVICGVLFFSSDSTNEQARIGLSEVKQAMHSHTGTLGAARSPWTQPPFLYTQRGPPDFSSGVPEKFSQLASASGQSVPAKIHLCPELIVPPASECTLVVPQLSARILQESEATLTICDITGNRLLYVSLSTTTAEPPNDSKFGNASDLRLSLKAVHDNTLYAFCSVSLQSNMPRAETTRLITVAFLDSAGRYFADLVQCAEAGMQDHYIVSTSQGWDILWRGTGPKIAVDSDGRQIAKVQLKISDEIPHTVTGGSGVDMGLIILSLLATDLFSEID